jgi:hypothetical protein
MQEVVCEDGSLFHFKLSKCLQMTDQKLNWPNFGSISLYKSIQIVQTFVDIQGEVQLHFYEILENKQSLNTLHSKHANECC